MKQRVALTVAYDGTAYAGWQRQTNAPSVQGTLEEALFSLTGERTAINGASRTDAGVHALGQVAHFDTESRIPEDRFALALNTRLPDDIRVLHARHMPPCFHSRFSARGKIYRYQIHNHQYGSALFRNLRAHVRVPLDEKIMHEAAQQIVGEHDFKAFAASGSEAKITIRNVWSCDVARLDDLIEITVSGRSFLYNMVRILAGTLIHIGMKKLPPEALKKALQTGDRLDLGITAPACGLTLMKVFYDDYEGD